MLQALKPTGCHEKGVSQAHDLFVAGSISVTLPFAMMGFLWFRGESSTSLTVIMTWEMGIALIWVNHMVPRAVYEWQHP